jgi:hypothetical protein
MNGAAPLVKRIEQGRSTLRSKIISAVAAAALIVSPTIASAQTAKVAPAHMAPAPASEKVDGSEIRGGFILPLVAIIALIIAIILLTKNDDKPHSP